MVPGSTPSGTLHWRSKNRRRRLDDSSVYSLRGDSFSSAGVNTTGVSTTGVSETLMSSRLNLVQIGRQR
jgi:hypothetical protein